MVLNYAKQRFLRAQTEKLEAETKNLRLQSDGKSDAAKSFVEKYAPAGSLVLALAALGTLALNLLSEMSEREAQHKTDIAEAIESLSSASEIKRIAAIAVIRDNLADVDLGDTYLTALAVAYGSERHSQVRSVLLASLSLQPNRAVELLADVRAGANVEAMARLSALTSEIGRLRAQMVAKADGDVLTATLDNVSRKLADMSAAQWSAIYASDGIRKINCKLTASVVCPIDLSGLVLRSISFAERDIDLVAANFSGAFLSSADFFKVDLRDAVFTRAVLNYADFFGANVSGATFAAADMSARGESMSESEIRRCLATNGTRFSGDLSKATFDGADLSGANFSDAKVQTTQILRASWKGAVLPSEVAAVLKYTNPKSMEVSAIDNNEMECRR